MTAETPLMKMGRLNQVYMTLSGARAQLDSMDEHVAFVDEPSEAVLELLSDAHLRVLDMSHDSWVSLGNAITLLMAQVHIQRVVLAQEAELAKPHELHPVRSREPVRITPRKGSS
jgi:hypothetical protein